MKKSISPIYFFSNKVNREGKRILYCRIRINRKKSEFATGIYAFPEKWNEQFRRSTNDQLVNKELSDLETRLQDIADKLYFDNKSITAKLIVDLYKGKNHSNYSISEYFNYYLYGKGKIKILAKGYSSKFITLNKYLKNFTKEYYDTINYDIRSVDFKFISDFDVFLKAMISKQYKRPLSPVYVYKMHGMFRTILISAYKEGIIRYQPYQSFPIRKVRTEIKYLSGSELGRLKALDLSDNHSLETVRDIFLFSVYTGLRFKDSQNITMNDIEYENGELKYLIKVQQKTNDKVEIPILKQTLEIINKYNNTEHRKTTGCLMPKFSNVKLNAYLKVIGDLAIPVLLRYF